MLEDVWHFALVPVPRGVPGQGRRSRVLWPAPARIRGGLIPGCPFSNTIAQERVPKIGYLSSWGAKVVLKWPSGALGPAPGPPEGYLSTTLVPHELRYPILGTVFCAMITLSTAGAGPPPFCHFCLTPPSILPYDHDRAASPSSLFDKPFP